MKRIIPAALLVALPLLGACNGNDRLADAQRARDLELALQAQRLQNPAMVSPMEMGQQQPQGGQWVYVPPGYAPPAYATPQQVYGPAPMPVYGPAPQPQPVYRTASASRSAPAPAPAHAPRRVTHVKRDAVIGAAAGAVAGAAIGRNVKGAVIGAAAGGVLGAVVGSTIDVDHR
jgi:hypothetical protein